MSHDNRVVGNLVHDFGQGILSDFGGIYTLGTSVRTLVASNIIYDGNARIYGGNGIYADAGTTGVTFSNNNVSRVSDAGIHLNYGRDVVFTGNIVAYFGEAGSDALMGTANHRQFLTAIYSTLLVHRYYLEGVPTERLSFKKRFLGFIRCS